MKLCGNDVRHQQFTAQSVIAPISALAGNERMIPASFLRPTRLPEIESRGLVLKSSRYASANLLIIGEEELTAAFLDDDFQYESMPCSKAESWSGLFIKDVELRVDPSSVYDLNGYFAPLGMLTFGSDGVCIVAKFGENRTFLRNKKIPFGFQGLEGRFPTEVGFTRWELGITVDHLWNSLWQVTIQSTDA